MALVKKLNEKNSRLSTIFDSVIGALFVTLIVEIGIFPVLLSWIKNSTWSVLVTMVDDRYQAASSLQPPLYSFYTLAIISLIACVFWALLVEQILQEIFIKEKERKNERQTPSDKMLKSIMGFFIISISGLLLYMLMKIAGQVITLNAITDFNQHMRIIKPYISNEDYDKHLSNWSQMESLGDYNKVYEPIMKVANENNLTLRKLAGY